MPFPVVGRHARRILLCELHRDTVSGPARILISTSSIDTAEGVLVAMDKVFAKGARGHLTRDRIGASGIEMERFLINWPPLRERGSLYEGGLGGALVGRLAKGCIIVSAAIPNFGDGDETLLNSMSGHRPSLA